MLKNFSPAANFINEEFTRKINGIPSDMWKESQQYEILRVDLIRFLSFHFSTMNDIAESNMSRKSKLNSLRIVRDNMFEEFSKIIEHKEWTPLLYNISIYSFLGEKLYTYIISCIDTKYKRLIGVL